MVYVVSTDIAGHMVPVLLTFFKRLISFDENTLQLGVIRDKDVDGEGQAMIIVIRYLTAFGQNARNSYIKIENAGVKMTLVSVHPVHKYNRI